MCSLSLPLSSVQSAPFSLVAWLLTHRAKPTTIHPTKHAHSRAKELKKETLFTLFSQLIDHRSRPLSLPLPRSLSPYPQAEKRRRNWLLPRFFSLSAPPPFLLRSALGSAPLFPRSAAHSRRQRRAWRNCQPLFAPPNAVGGVHLSTFPPCSQGSTWTCSCLIDNSHMIKLHA